MRPSAPVVTTGYRSAISTADDTVTTEPVWTASVIGAASETGTRYRRFQIAWFSSSRPAVAKIWSRPSSMRKPTAAASEGAAEELRRGLGHLVTASWSRERLRQFEHLDSPLAHEDVVGCVDNHRADTAGHPVVVASGPPDEPLAGDC